MPDFDCELPVVVTELDDNLLSGEILFFNELAALAQADTALVHQLARNVQMVVKDCRPLDWFRRRSNLELDVVSVSLEIEPTRKAALRFTPVSLTFHAVVWPQAGYEIAYVPVLGIEHLAKDRTLLLEQLPEQIRFAVQRRQMNGSLRALVETARVTNVRVLKHLTSLTLKTPKEIQQAEGERERGSVLKTCATRLKPSSLAPAFQQDALIERLGQALGGERKRSVLLIGPSGVGKTAIYHEVIRRRTQFDLRGVEFWQSSGARLVAGTCGYGMWQKRCRELCDEVARKRVLLHLGGLVELLEAGRGGGSSQGIANYLRPRIERGELQVIVECTPEQFAVVERNHPSLLQTLWDMRIEEPNETDGRSILQAFADSQADSAAKISAAALDVLDRHHRRYATYSVFPGRPLRFLRNLLDDSCAAKPTTAEQTKADQVIDEGAVTRAFSRETGLPRVLLDDAEQLDVELVEQWFRGRVIGQTVAVQLLVDLLAAVKTRLSRPQRPIASLVFVGPTGVGKTEMAKAIAEFLFSSLDMRELRRHLSETKSSTNTRDDDEPIAPVARPKTPRMVRIDMSEYSDFHAIDRLVGGESGGEGLLTSTVRDQPFGVVLLDEFEKAHPRFFDILLQVLGEGRLTDAAGRVADFRNSLIIMTSNLGAQSLKRGQVGFDNTATSSDVLASHYTRELESFVRPEFFNRIDRVVPFQPLDRENLDQIARREWDLVQRRDGLQYRSVRLDLGDAALKQIVTSGFDPRYGARPLKRAIEQLALLPMSHGLNRYADDLNLTVDVGCDAGEIGVKVRAVDGQARTVGATDRDAGEPAISLARRTCELRRAVQRIDVGPVATETRNEIFRLDRSLAAAIKQKRAPEPHVAKRYGLLDGFLKNLDRLSGDIVSLEDDTLLRLYGDEPVDIAAGAELLETLQEDWNRLLLDAFALSFRDADKAVTLAIYGENSGTARKLAAAYLMVSEAHELAARLYLLKSPQGDLDQHLTSKQFWIAKPEKKQERGNLQANAEPEADRVSEDEPTTTLIGHVVTPADIEEHMTANVVGVALRFSGPLAYPIFEAERGVHVFIQGSETYRCLVDIDDEQLEARTVHARSGKPRIVQYKPPVGADRRHVVDQYVITRKYNRPKQVVEDIHLQQSVRWADRTINKLLPELIRARLLRMAKSQVCDDV
ncbi:MAG: AAA family ATPase [Planctomycetota bacterium]|nr:AAA family ATPase [Planctomycetota bacterium]